MSISAIILILISAILHISWNLISKKSNPSLAFFFLANTFGGLLLLFPISLYFNDFYAHISLKAIAIAALSGIFQCVYYWTLALAYRTGQISLAYPIARSFPVIFVTAFMVALGFTDVLNAAFLMGSCFIIVGSIILPMRHFKDLKLANYLNQTTFYALIAAVGTAGYSIADANAISHLSATFGQTSDKIALTLVYAFIAALFSSLWMSLFLMSKKHYRHEVKTLFTSHYKTIILAGLAIHMAYTLVLVSMSMVENVSYIVAFRQVSIPLGVILGIVILKEQKSLPKTIGVIAMFLGVILVSS